MANEDLIKQRGVFNIFKDNRGGSVTYDHPIIGIVKNNIDPLRSGKIQVYLDRLNGPDQDDPDNWTWVNYASPFFGYTQNTASNNSDGTFVGNRNSYGFWATPPDINTQVICFFINGQPDLGYYIASIPPPALIHMVPGIGASKNVIPNEGEADSYGGATSLPVTELNDANTEYENTPELPNVARPIHSYQAAILNVQGLIRDTVRGTISSSAMRESPSHVFGLSTPGSPIYAGGFNGSGSKTLSEAINDSSIPDEQFAVIGRTGGHSLILDDGDYDGNNKLLRLRTSQGHMLLMNDSAETLFIIHANGQSWIELGKEGTIDMYATNSVNIRTQGDLNLHADNNINVNAKKNLNISAENINMESLQATSQFVGTDYKGFVKNNYTLKVNSKMSLYSKDDSSIKSDKTNYLNGGPNVHLNTGASSLVPEEVKQLPIIAHTDTLYDDSKGYLPAPGKLSSIVSRAPAHQPWANGNQGVDVKVNMSASANFPSPPNENVQQLNQSVVGTPTPVTSPAVMATVPNLNPVGNPLDKITTTALVSQMAVDAANGPSANAVRSSAGVVDINGQKVASIGSLALTPSQLEEAGYLKPGSSVAVNTAISNGKTIEQAMPPNVFTGKNGIAQSGDLINNASAQSVAAADVLGNSEQALIQAGAITGKESSGQIGGLVLAGATVGVGPTLDVLKASAIGSGSNFANIGTSKLSASNNDPTKLIAGGNAAANLADKQNTGLGGLLKKVGSSVQGAAASVWSKITGSLKKLTANKPQNLDAANSTAAKPKQTSSDALGADQQNKSNFTDKVKNNLSNVSVADALITTSLLAGGPAASASNLAKVTGGLAITAKILDKGQQPLTIGKLGDKIKNVASNLFKGKQGVKAEVNELTTDLAKNSGSVNALATTGLSDAEIQEFESQLASAGTPGAIDIKAPTVANNTFNNQGLANQSKSLLGNSKIPSPVKSTVASTNKSSSPPTSASTLSSANSAQNVVNAKKETYKNAQEAFNNGTLSKEQLLKIENDFYSAIDDAEKARQKYYNSLGSNLPLD